MMYKWKIRFRSVYLSAFGDNQQLDRSQRMYNAGFTELALTGRRFDGADDGFFYHYTTTHKSRSAMMMHMLKYPDDGIIITEDHTHV
jgi:hypothetical protein